MNKVGKELLFNKRFIMNMFYKQICANILILLSVCLSAQNNICKRIVNPSNEDIYIWWSSSDISDMDNAEKINDYFFTRVKNSDWLNRFSLLIQEDLGPGPESEFFFKRLHHGESFSVELKNISDTMIFQTIIAKHLVIMDSSSFFTARKSMQGLHTNRYSFIKDSVIIDVSKENARY